MNARWHVEWNLNKVTSSIILIKQSQNTHSTPLVYAFISHNSTRHHILTLFYACIHVHVQWTKDTLIDPESITIFYVTVIKHWRAVLSKLYILNKYDSISEYERNNKIDI